MPPRYAYWTILIDDKPTAFRAREREELQPTFVQLQRKNSNVTMQWFARGKLWASREAERDDFQAQRHAASAPREPRDPDAPKPERRGSEWRPGGAHKDPRDRFKKKNRPERAWSEKDPATQRDRDKPGYVAKPRGEWRDKPVGPARGDRPWQDKPRGDRPAWKDKPSGDRPWSGKPSGPPRDRKPWQDRQASPSARRSASDQRPSGGGNDRPWQTKPTGPRAQRKPWVGKPGPPGEGAGFKPRSDRPWQNKPPVPPRERKPWAGKPPSDAPRGDRPPDRSSSSDRRPSGGGWNNRPPTGEKRPWSGKPRGDKPGGFSAGGPPRERKPWSGKPAGGGWQKKPFRPAGPPRPDARKKRDDDD